MKTLIITLLLVFVAGCTSGNDIQTKAGDFPTICLNGVVYYATAESVVYSGYGYMAVKFNRDGTVATCE